MSGLVGWLSLTGATIAGGATIDFNRDVRPILAENCFQCHGPDAEQRQGELRLDTADGSRENHDGRFAVVPGKPEMSELVKRILATDETQMPPLSAEKPLTAKQIALLREWIAVGAPYSVHWSFEPLQAVALPLVENTIWSHNAIDRFVLSRLDHESIRPAPVAARSTLIRRVHLDLLGIPPTVAEVDAFQQDRRPDAYERMVDRGIARPGFGERWGRHWLDQARYADSHGYTNDNERIMWPYRDWVIRALNRDLAFDQFTIEQLAGDLLPDPNIDQLVATGFHRNTLINTEGGTKPDQFKDEQVKDRVDTTGTVWLGLTVGCAKCHAHKYDPISQEEYYQLYAFFNSTADRNSETPKIKVPTVDQSRRSVSISKRLSTIRGQFANDPELARRQKAWEAALRQVAAQEPPEPETQNPESPEPQVPVDGKPLQSPVDWATPEPSGKSLAGTELQLQDDGSLLASGANEVSDEYQVVLRSPLTKVRSVRLELLEDASLPQHGPGRSAAGTIRLSEFWFRTGDGRELRFSSVVSQNENDSHPAQHSIDNETPTGWETVTSDPRQATAWFVLPDDLLIEENHALTFFMQFETTEAAANLGRFRISLSSTPWVDIPSQQELQRLAAIPDSNRKPHHSGRLANAFRREDSKTAALFLEAESLQREADKIQSQIAEAMILRELDERPAAFIQIRGDFLRPDASVEPDVPAVLPSLEREENASIPTRLDLARWLVRKDHPLTGRVQMNRIWMRLFGQGLVATENDFGIQSSSPTHPKLLDWLAGELPRHDWSIKRSLRTIICSQTYRQSSSRLAGTTDPGRLQQLLATQRRLRVEAETVRDISLAVSGLLQPVVGGPSVFPPQPEGVYAFTQRAKEWHTSQGTDRYRRGIYTFLYRSAPYPMMTTFDAPGLNTSCTRRDRSNTPLQALTLANSVAAMEMATAFADRIIKEGGETTDDQLRFAFRVAVSRPPREDELGVLRHFYQSQLARFSAEPEATRTAWTATARVVLNLDEVITRE